MKLVGKIIIALGSNAIGLAAIDYFIEGVSVSKDIREFISITVILTIANMIVRPIAKVILSPLILITLGLFTVLINAGILYVVDIIYTEITISGLMALLIATVIMSAINAGIKIVSKF